MSTAAPRRIVADESGPTLMTKIAAVVVVLALAGLAYYAMFSGPTTVSVPSTGGPTSTPSKTAPPAEEQFPEEREGGNGG